MQALVIHFDDEAETAIRGVWRRLTKAGIPVPDRFPPHLTLAAAGVIPRKARDAVRAELGRLALPSVWLASLSTFTASENVLMLAAVTDPELIAVHSAVHDALAGQVRNQQAYYLPGSWMPHCTLARGVTDAQVIAGFAAVFPVPAIRAKVRQIVVTDTTTGDTEVLISAA
jgi:2'-5' RNA ligase